MFVFDYVWKARRKDRDVGTTSIQESKQYLEPSVLETNIPEYKMREIVHLPEELDYNEWLASHTIAFFDHINLVYGTVSEFCTMSGCPDIIGPGNRQYVWIDEKGKRLKLTAPQYIDYVMTYTQKTLNEESIFPTKFDKEFPSSFESIVKKIIKLLFHVLAHIYHSHFKEIVFLKLHSHLNCVFSHLVLFNERFKLIDEQETEVLHDLAVALKLFPPDEKPRNLVDISLPQSPESLFQQESFNNEINNDILANEWRSISPLMDESKSTMSVIKDEPKSLSHQVPFTNKQGCIKSINYCLSDKSNMSSSEPSIPLMYDDDTRRSLSSCTAEELLQALKSSRFRYPASYKYYCGMDSTTSFKSSSVVGSLPIRF